MNKKYLLSEASKVSLHTNLSCTCVKSLHLWLAFAPNIQKKTNIFHLHWCNLFGKYLKNMPSCTCPRPIWREILANYSTPAPWHWIEWKWIAGNHNIELTMTRARIVVPGSSVHGLIIITSINRMTTSVQCSRTRE